MALENFIVKVYTRVHESHFSGKSKDQLKASFATSKLSSVIGYPHGVSIEDALKISEAENRSYYIGADGLTHAAQAIVTEIKR